MVCRRKVHLCVEDWNNLVKEHTGLQETSDFKVARTPGTNEGKRQIPERTFGHGFASNDTCMKK